MSTVVVIDFTATNVFLGAFAGFKIELTVWLVTVAEAVPAKTTLPITPSMAPIRYLRLRIPLLFRWASSLTAAETAGASP